MGEANEIPFTNPWDFIQGRRLSPKKVNKNIPLQLLGQHTREQHVPTQENSLKFITQIFKSNSSY